MRAYFDSGVITKWYGPEVNSAAALALRKRFKPPIWLTPLHRVELTAAWRLKVLGGAAEVTITQLLGDFRQDVARRLYVAPEVDEGEAARIGENLADHYSVRLGTRSLDVRHVAWALAAGATAFVTGDERPARWAEAIGLKMTRL